MQGKQLDQGGFKMRIPIISINNPYLGLEPLHSIKLD